MLPRTNKGTALLALGLAVLLSTAGGPAARAQGMVPYYGKNKVKYDQFDWRVYKSPHFEVYYYPEFEQHLARVASYLESAYEKLSSGLKHEISQPIPAILYKTWTEFEQTNLNPGFLPEGVLAFAEPGRGRLTLPIDLPPDRLNGLIQHEMTHIFAFDIIPRTILPARHPAVDRRGPGQLLRRRLEPAGPDDDPRRRGHRADPEAVEIGLPAPLRPPRLQPGPRGLRVHREPLRQGRHPSIPLHACARGSWAETSTTSTSRPSASRPRTSIRPSRSGCRSASSPSATRSGPATTGEASPRTPRRPPTSRSSASPPAPRERSSPPSPPTATKARATSCCSPPATAACSRT